MPNPIVKKAIKTAVKKSSNMKKMPPKKAAINRRGWVEASPGVKAIMLGAAGTVGAGAIAAGAGVGYGAYKGVQAINDALKRPTPKETKPATKTSVPVKSTTKPAVKTSVTTPKEKPMVKGSALKKMGGMTKSKKK